MSNNQLQTTTTGNLSRVDNNNISQKQLAILDKLGKHFKKVYISHIDKKVKESTDDEIRTVLVYCMTLLPLAEKPTKQQMVVTVDFMRDNFENTTLSEIKNSFSLAVARIIVVSADLDKVYRFSVSLVTSCLQGYEIYKAQKMKLINSEFQKLNASVDDKPISIDEEFEGLLNRTINIYKEIVIPEGLLEETESYKRVDDYGFLAYKLLHNVEYRLSDKQDELCEKLALQEIKNNAQKTNTFSQAMTVIEAWQSGKKNDKAFEIIQAIRNYTVSILLTDMKYMGFTCEQLKELILDRKELFIKNREDKLC